MMAKILNNTKAGITDEVTVSSLSKGDTTTNDIMATSSKINGEYNDEIFALLHGELVNQTFLSSFYTNPQRYGFAFQMYMLTTRLFQMQTASFYAKNYGQFQLLDRGAVGDALFALYNASAGNITDEELSVYKSVCADRLPSSLSHKVDIVAFLDVSPLECYRRMNSMRQRDAEKEVVPDYLEGLDQSYFELMVKWLGHRTDACGGINIGLPPPVVIFDWSEFGCSKAVLQKLARAALSHDEQVQYLKSIKHQFTGEEELDQVRATRQVAHNVLVRPEVHFLQPGQEDINQLSELTTVDIVTDEAQLEALYNEITETKLIMGRDGRPVQHLVVDWALPHTNSFRRVVMKHLAREGQVTFINSDHTGLVM
jgi:deoxyadenosine/deoxycytidine kinase